MFNNLELLQKIHELEEFHAKLELFLGVIIFCLIIVWVSREATARMEIQDWKSKFFRENAKLSEDKDYQAIKTSLEMIRYHVNNVQDIIDVPEVTLFEENYEDSGIQTLPKYPISGKGE